MTAELPPQPEPDDRARYWAEATYHLLVRQRRRATTLALVVAVVFGLVGGFAAVQWVDLRNDVDAVEDRLLVEGLGIEIPDPRPSLQRTDLRVRAFAWGVVALWTGTISLLALGVAALLRPPPLLPPPPRGRTGQGPPAHG